MRSGVDISTKLYFNYQIQGMENQPDYHMHKLQKIALGIMAIMMVLTFVAANLHAVLWQSSQWLVSTVLPAVVVTLTNEERTDESAAPLKRSEVLDRAARMKAEHMAKNQYFSHYAPDGTSPWYWFDQAGYLYAHAGENLAIHFTDSSEVVEAWMKSPTHRQNIVNNNYTEIGVGTAKGKFEGFDTVYVVQLFGAPAAVPVRVATPAPVAPVSTPTSVAQAPEPVNEEVVLAAESNLTEVPVLPEGTPAPQEVTEVTESEVLLDTEAVPVPDVIELPESNLTVSDNEMVIESSIATSSGLAMGTISLLENNQEVSSLVGLATKPNTLLQIAYTILGLIVIGLLAAAALMESKKMHYMQVAYSFALLIGMASLWYVHTLLTMGASIA